MNKVVKISFFKHNIKSFHSTAAKRIFDIKNELRIIPISQAFPRLWTVGDIIKVWGINTTLSFLWFYFGVI